MLPQHQVGAFKTTVAQRKREWWESASSRSHMRKFVKWVDLFEQIRVFGRLFMIFIEKINRLYVRSLASVLMDQKKVRDLLLSNFISWVEKKVNRTHVVRLQMFSIEYFRSKPCGVRTYCECYVRCTMMYGETKLMCVKMGNLVPIWFTSCMFSYTIHTHTHTHLVFHSREQMREW